MYTKEDVEIIKKIIIENAKGLNSVYLFGSYSTGKANKNSDLDVALITENKINRKNKLDLLNKLWNKVGDKGYSVDIIIKSFKDFETEKTLPTLSQVIANSGKILWQKA